LPWPECYASHRQTLAYRVLLSVTKKKKGLQLGRPGKASRRSLEHRQGSGVPDEEVSGQEQAHGRLETRLQYARFGILSHYFCVVLIDEQLTNSKIYYDPIP
jgi:hypothetical protein